MRKTGTSYKKTTTEIYKYYLMCIDCGCQYALNLSKELIERTNFISIYFYLRNILSKDISIKAAHINSGFTVDELKRAIAYFDSRGIFRFENYHIDTIREILNDFVRALQAGEKIKDIEKWARWNSQYEFLFYRYHNEVLQFESSRNLYEQPKNVIPNINKLQTTILPILESMLYNNKIITIGNVCKAAGICPETLRLWGGCPYVSDMKERQYKKRIDEDINKLYMDIKTYLEMNIFSEVSASSLYNYLGFTRIKLWRVSPELTTFISTQVRNHNQLIHTDFK